MREIHEYVVQRLISLIIQLFGYLGYVTSRHVHDTTDAIPSLDNYSEQGRWNGVHATYMHIVEPFVDLFEFAVMSNIFVDLECTFEIV